MNLSPEDRAALIEVLAVKIMAKLEAEVDFPSLITLPLDAVAQCVGLGPTQTARVMPTRSMGKRKLGVSLRDLLDYQARPQVGRTTKRARKQTAA